jgi:hypothetical protein
MPAKWPSNSIAGMARSYRNAAKLENWGRQSAGPIAALFANGRKSLAAWLLLQCLS